MNPSCLPVAVLLVVISAGAAAQSPPPLNVYSDDFVGGSTPAPGSAQRGVTIAVDVDVLDAIEAATTDLETRMHAHLGDGGAHQPHAHPHTHCPPGTFEASVSPTDDAGAPQIAEDGAPGLGECPVLALLDEALTLLVSRAEAQSQPPPLQVYDPNMITPGAPAPTSPRNNLDVTLDVDIPLIEQVQALIRALDVEIAAHVAARPGHAHDHPHGNGGGSSGGGSEGGGGVYQNPDGTWSGPDAGGPDHPTQ